MVSCRHIVLTPLRSARTAVLSFISTWSSQPPPSPTSPTFPDAQYTSSPTPGSPVRRSHDNVASPTAAVLEHYTQSSPTPTAQARKRADSRPSSRPVSMVQTYQPPLMEVAQDTLPELQPIFTFLNSHSNKLYQEGYFLKLHDLDTRGRPSGDRTWTECFAQLVGTILSFWDAAHLDAAGEDGEVVPTFINLADASIKMIESLPMNGQAGQSLQNVLSISTAANNRYLFHFNSLNSLTQWTAGIRLAMYEHATLQEAYTGSLIAGKGKHLNNIRTIMDRTKFKQEDWARVRFGAGTPWRRCWCVVTPPDEKEFQKLQKTRKKRNPYDRSTPILKGDVKFYDTRRVTKKTQPIATITDAYSAYAIYPQSKPLIDQSTLVKVEGNITIHGQTDSSTEGFVFVMPEVHPAVSGFEIMLRFLFPLWDVFAMYGRPQRLIADVLDTRGLMFALPKDRRYGYLEILDVSGLIHTTGSQTWSEKQWRKQMKDLTSKRMSAVQMDGGRSASRASRRNTTSRASLPGSRNGVKFEDGVSIRSQPSSRQNSLTRKVGFQNTFDPPKRVDSAPPGGGQPALGHRRSASEATGYSKPYQREMEARGMYEPEMGTMGTQTPPPRPPPHRDGAVFGSATTRERSGTETTDQFDTASEGKSSPESEIPFNQNQMPEVRSFAASPPPVAVAAPPAFTHAPSQRPSLRPNVPSDLRRAHSGIDAATLSQIEDANGMMYAGGAPQDLPYRGSPSGLSGQPGDYDRRWEENGGQRGMVTDYNESEADLLGAPPGYWDQSQNQNQAMFSAKNRHPTSRLPTIPASPYVDQVEPSPKRSYFEPAGPTVPEHSESSTPVQQVNAMPPPPLERSGSSFSVQRKPLPSAPGQSGHTTAGSEQDPSMTRKSVEDSRDGVQRTVGAPEPNAKYDETTDMPSTDSGPMAANAPDRGERRTREDGPKLLPKTANSGQKPSAEKLKQTHASERLDSSSSDGNTARTMAWQPGMVSSDHKRTLTPEEWVQQRAAIANTPMYAHARNKSSTSSPSPLKPNRNPSPSSGQLFNRSPSQAPPPATPPLSRPASRDWSHLASVTQPRRETPSPLSGRKVSPQTPNLEPDYFDRPISRGRGTPSPSNALIYPPRISSREGEHTPPRFTGVPQYYEHGRISPSPSQYLNGPSNSSPYDGAHVPRLTSAPLLQQINVGGRRTPSSPKLENPTGLVGAIAAREQEKQAMKYGYSGAAVQQGISQANKQRQLPQQMMYSTSQSSIPFVPVLDNRAATPGLAQIHTNSPRWQQGSPYSVLHGYPSNPMSPGPQYQPQQSLNQTSRQESATEQPYGAAAFARQQGQTGVFKPTDQQRRPY
ncbi:hypothetical protein K402DRAFT_401707 [Aulographum hederae CBS 113979]|uniref:PH domain-containing protein n=1 Tax=Aulographum hederae CBS 113979 TaxID=1176131 RepID=A0A6G1H958_9PEZI|nr:hypothetical protein K402DRAFT_401707 [Aulographum hederae CBS 113979]